MVPLKLVKVIPLGVLLRTAFACPLLQPPLYPNPYFFSWLGVATNPPLKDRWSTAGGGGGGQLILFPENWEEGVKAEL